MVGPSDAGKSAIIRALRWLSTNEPKGDSFVRQGAEFAEVRILIDNHTVARLRGKENTYSLDNSEFKAFKDKPPEQISSLLNVGDVNFQGQHDAIFWFSLTAGEVAKELNKIVNLSIIDDAMAFVSQKVRSTRTEVEVCEKRLNEYKEERSKLNLVPMLCSDFDDLTKLEDQKTKSEENALKLANALVEARRCSAFIKKTKGIKVAFSKVEACRTRVKEITQSTCSLSDTVAEFNKRKAIAEQTKGVDRAFEVVAAAATKYNDLIVTSRGLAAIRDHIDQHTQTFRRTSSVIVKLQPLLNKISELRPKANELSIQAEKLRDGIDLIKRAQKATAEAKTKYSEAKVAFEEETKGVCPICGNKIKNNTNE